MKNRDWVVVFSVFFVWVLAQSLLREAVGALFGLVIGILGLAAIAAGMWLVVRRRKARAAAAESAETAAADAAADADAPANAEAVDAPNAEAAPTAATSDESASA